MLARYDATARGWAIKRAGTHGRVTGGYRGYLRVRDLAPSIHRQRLTVEGIPANDVDSEQIRGYLRAVSRVTGMKPLLEPVTHRSDRYGWAGWIHWETSGAHFYAWEQPLRFFSVDVYACKPFDSRAVVALTRDYFSADQVEFREF